MASGDVRGLMAYLADHYQEGILITCVIVVTLYLAFSIRLVFTSKDVEMKILASAFIPILNIILWVIKCIKNVRRKKKERVFLSDTDEFSL